jgi:presenilin enhancer 2
MSRESSRTSSAGTTTALELEHSSADSAAAALDLKVARRMFYGGFAGLPWLWFIAWLHFRHAAQLPSADPQLAAYARRSGIGALVGGLLFVSWVVYVQLTWRSWGEFGRSMMLYMPEDDDEL